MVWEVTVAIVAILSGIAASVVVIAKLIHQLVVVPVKKTANEALNMAVENRQKHAELMSHLVGTDAPTDEGILLEHSAKLEEIGQKIDGLRLLDTEQTYIFQEVLKQVEGVEIEETEEGYLLRREGQPDGGVEIHHDYK